MKTPPLLPEETLHRVLRVANLDGMSVLAIAGILALASAAGGDYMGAAIGLLVAAAGAIELHGAGLVRAGETRGMKWVVASQPYLLVVLLGYCVLRLTNFDLSMLQAAMTDEMRETIRQAGYRVDQFLRMVYNLTYGTLAFATLLYQGGMTIYYWRRRGAVETALEGEEQE